jgi:hypothetical protein
VEGTGEAFSLTPNFSWVNHVGQKDKPFQRFLRPHTAGKFRRGKKTVETVGRKAPFGAPN